VAISPGGIWVGTENATGRDLIGIISETGEYHFLREDGIQFFGGGVINGQTFSGAVTAIASSGTTFADGSSGGAGQFTAQITERSRLQGTVTITTSPGRSETIAFTATYDAVHQLDSALSVIAGNYARFDRRSAVLNINSNGVIFGQDPVSGCVINGQASILDARYDGYRVILTHSLCTGPSIALNNVALTGLAAYDNTESPAAIIVFSNGRSGAATFALTLLYERI
jgi:hypothetical protein